MFRPVRIFCAQSDKTLAYVYIALKQLVYIIELNHQNNYI